MKRKWWMRIGFVVLLLGLSYPGYRTTQWYLWREHPDAATGVDVLLGPKTQTVKVGDAPKMFISFFNRGAKEVILVEPGDGSESGWRTPVIEWSGNSYSGAMCPNVNQLKESEVFVLQAGHHKVITEWVEYPPFFSPGRYSVSLRYTNLPEHTFRGDQDPVALEKVRGSTKVRAVSNAVEIIVEK